MGNVAWWGELLWLNLVGIPPQTSHKLYNLQYITLPL